MVQYSLYSFALGSIALSNVISLLTIQIKARSWGIAINTLALSNVALKHKIMVDLFKFIPVYLISHTALALITTRLLVSSKSYQRRL
jgi:hypothetical protein